MPPSRWLFWHRRDLRLKDNLGLFKSRTNTPAITGVFVLDEETFPEDYSNIKLAPSQIWFLTRSLEELKKNWEEIGGDLIFLHGNPIELIPKLAEIINAQVVCWNNDIEPEHRSTESKLSFALQKQRIKIFTCWDQLLIPPNELKNLKGEPYKVYGAFWKKWSSKIEEESYIASQKKGLLSVKKSPDNLLKLNEKQIKEIKNVFGKKYLSEPFNEMEVIRNQNSFNGINICPCKPGERNGRIHLKEFLENNKIMEYFINRDIPFNHSTSKISASLRFGTISPRQAWEVSEIALYNSEKSTQIESIITWRKELCWREFYQNNLFNFPEIVNGPYRKKWKNFPWLNNTSWFNAWTNGLTGIPIVDASIRQLNQTGWMHNRCRMIVASFLVKDLICDWRLGENAFMRKLVDGDLAANNGGWQWTASSGMDTKPLRIFNPFSQSKKYDSKAKYIRKWVPELKNVSTENIITGTISNLERNLYPKPIVNHQEQQAMFKDIYRNL